MDKHGAVSAVNGPENELAELKLKVSLEVSTLESTAVKTKLCMLLATAHTIQPINNAYQIRHRLQLETVTEQDTLDTSKRLAGVLHTLCNFTQQILELAPSKLNS